MCTPWENQMDHCTVKFCACLQSISSHVIDGVGNVLCFTILAVSSVLFQA